MTQDEIIEMAIQGHAGTRDAIRWAINQVVKAEREACMTQEALRMALDALEVSTDWDVNATGKQLKSMQAITALRKALAQTQEPVDWRNAAIRAGEDLCSVGPFGYYDMTADQWLTWALSVVTVHSFPPHRTWVGLTDEERSQLVTLHHGWNEYGQAIEAKLKQKNS